MSNSIGQYPRIYGVRLSVSDSRKLQLLCRHMQRSASEVLRVLVRQAEPVDVAPVKFAAREKQEG